MLLYKIKTLSCSPVESRLSISGAHSMHYFKVCKQKSSTSWKPCNSVWNCGFLPLSLLSFVELLQGCDVEIGVDVLCKSLFNLGLKNDNSSAARRGSIMLQSMRNVVYWIYRVLLQDGNPPLDPSEHFMAEEEKLTDQERSKRWACSSIPRLPFCMYEVVFSRGKKKSLKRLLYFPDLKKPIHILCIIWHKSTNTWRWLRRLLSIAILLLKDNLSIVATTQWNGHSTLLLCHSTISLR